jgi:protein-L-isoaspartate(D-aspartate) O-methyltransferase
LDPAFRPEAKCLDDDFSQLARSKMIEDLRAHGLDNPQVFAVMSRVPRHCFVPTALRAQAYHDGPLAIGQGQTISQPFMVALMTQSLKLSPGEKVLEVGTGSGYQTAILAELGAEVYSIERLQPLLQEARQRLLDLGYERLHFRLGDGTAGWEEEAPFDAILVAAGAPKPALPWKKQLTEGGRLVVPVGTRLSQTLMLYTKRGERLIEEAICGCVFVPLLGTHGWQEEDFG